MNTNPGDAWLAGKAQDPTPARVRAALDILDGPRPCPLAVLYFADATLAALTPGVGRGARIAAARALVAG